MINLPQTADHRQLRALGYPKRAAKRVARKHNQRRAVSPSHVASNPTSSRPRRPADVKAMRKMALAVGETSERIKLMAGADAELQALWLQQIGVDAQYARASDADEVRDRTAIMLNDDADPDLRQLFVQQLANREPASATPLAMDPDRYQLHTEAKQLAQTRCDASPRLDGGEAYALAAIEIEDRRSGAIWLS